MIQTRTIFFGAGATPDWKLNDLSASREFVSPDIPFATPFAGRPEMSVAISGLMATSASGNTFIIVEPVEVQSEEFNVRIVASQDAIIHGVYVTYIAHD